MASTTGATTADLSSHTSSDPTGLKEAEPVDGGGGVKVYTRTGDGGSSCLFNMERRDKDDAVFEALGDVDELNSWLGVARTFAGERSAGCQPPSASDEGSDASLELIARLEEVQSRLLDVGSAVATPLDASSDWKKARTAFEEGHVDALEAWIDAYDATLPPLKTFILPGGGRTASALHVARTVCRRAERRVVPLVRDELCPPVVGRYMNRLSDFLYTAARHAAMREGHPEAAYKKA